MMSKNSPLTSLWNLMVASTQIKYENEKTHRMLENMEKIISLGNKMEKMSKFDFEIKHDLREIWAHHRHLVWLWHQRVHPDFQRLEHDYDLKFYQIFSGFDWESRIPDILDLAQKDFEEQEAEERILKEVYQDLNTKIHHVHQVYRHFLHLVSWNRPRYIKIYIPVIPFSPMLCKRNYRWV